MKNPLPSLAVLAAVLGALVFSTAPSAHAGQSQAEAASILASGIWWFDGKGWTENRVFNADGTVTINGSLNNSARWRVDDQRAVIAFADHEEDLPLPIDPKGSSGRDGKGLPFVATLAKITAVAAATPAPAVTPPVPPPVATATPAPARAHTPVPVAANPVPSPVVAAPRTTAPPVPLTQDDEIKILEANVWTLKSPNVNEQLQFLPDRSVSLIEFDGMKPRAQPQASWRIDHFSVTITFPDREEEISLPLDPKGTSGKDGQGVELMATGKRNGSK